MFEQYRQLKESQPDALLFFRMGDFYEMFFEDAVVAAGILDITLTSRNRSDPNPIPMAGVPHHAVAGYIERLTAAGHRVAIAEQVEDPKQTKGLVRRAIVRVVTPSVTYDPATVEPHARAWLLAVAHAAGGYGLAWLDVSTGDLRVARVGQAAQVVAEIERFEPREILLAPTVDRAGLAEVLGPATVSRVFPGVWDPDAAQRVVCDVLRVAGVEGFGLQPGSPEVCAAGAALAYARDRLGGRLENVHRLAVYDPHGFMVVDETSRRNLELTKTLIEGRRRGSLLALVDLTATNMGSRRLADWLAFPMMQVDAIVARQGAVGALVADPAAREALRDALRGVADIERIMARVAQQTAHARDLAALARSLAAVPAVQQVAGELRTVAPHAPTDACADVAADLQQWLVEEPPAVLTEGGLIRGGAHPELDEVIALSLDGVSVIAKLEEEERAASGISSLKIKRNRVFGYFIEVSTANLHRVPDRFHRKQTLSNCERYITAELKELEERVLGADERRKELELELFRQLRERVADHAARLLELSQQLAGLDALGALSEVAVRERWCRPEVDGSLELEIVGGRHPMVEAALAEDRFVPNNISLGPERALIVLTGPNMSGKSTVLRQVALITLLAQVGSYVPAESARIGVCDRIFTRVGAADDLRRGQSTFMVEMAETSAILHYATERSLVVLDEIGRGTSTYDGLAIAWAVAEDLVDRIGARAMFATHYHELCELAATRPAVANQSVAVAEADGEIVFLRRLKEGGASRSYGVQCARLAGLPGQVVERATAMLTRFEKAAPQQDRQQLALFAAEAPAQPEEEEATDPLREVLCALDPDTLSPREAHAALYALRDLLD